MLTPFESNRNHYRNAQYFYKSPTDTNPDRSEYYENIYSHFIKEDDILYNNNFWPFINNKLLKTHNPEMIFTNEIIEPKVFILRHEVNNCGHSLVFIMYQIHYYITNRLDHKIVIPHETLNMSHTIRTIIELFINPNDMIIIDNNSVVKSDEILIIRCGFTFGWDFKCAFEVNPENVKTIGETTYIGQENEFKDLSFIMLINRIKEINYTPPITYKKIALVKTTDLKIESNYNLEFSIKRSFSNDYKVFLEENDVKFLYAHEYSCVELYHILSNAEFIVLSWGCISYMNKIFIDNENINFLLLAHTGYYHEYTHLKNPGDFVSKFKNCKIIYNLTTDFTEETRDIIYNNLPKTHMV